MFLTDKVGIFILFVTLGAQVLYRRSFWFLFPNSFEEILGKIKILPANRGGDQITNTEDKSYFFSKSFAIFLRILWVVSILTIFAFLISDSVLQYQMWQSSDLTKMFLPPHRSIGFFVSYVGFRIFAPWVLAFLAAFLVSRLAKKLNKKFGERFFENEEIELMALGIFLSGYPGFFIYLFLILLFGALAAAGYTIFSKGRMPFYYFWMPLAIFAIIIVKWLAPIIGLDSFLGQFILGDFGRLIFGI